MPRQPRATSSASAPRPAPARAGRAAASVRAIPVAQIAPSPRNPRRRAVGIEELAESLREYGLLQPVVVRPIGERFELIAGHRRFEAARRLGWSHIPAIERHEQPTDAYILTLVENLQRADLSPREEAAALEVLIRERGWGTREVAGAIKRSPAYVSKRLRVFEDPMLAPAVLANKLSVSAAEELLAVDAARRYDLLARAVEHGWDRAQVRRAAARPRGAAGQAAATRASVARSARELRGLLRERGAAGLTQADRRELRLLYLELGTVARAQTSGAIVFPPLPVA
jgi:ParB family transcriptional regulator, chromosome partitioning protein